MELTTLTIDFESFGGIPSEHGFARMGAVIVKNGQVVSSFESFAYSESFKKDERCISEFWEKQVPREVYNNTLKQIADKSNPNCWGVVENFWEWVDKTIKENNLSYVLPIGDNLPFDVGILQYFSNRDVCRPFGYYCEWIDVCSYYMGVGQIPLNGKNSALVSSKRAAVSELKFKLNSPNLTLPEFEVEHDHNPVNDATSIALYYHWFFERVQDHQGKFSFKD